MAEDQFQTAAVAAATMKLVAFAGQLDYDAAVKIAALQAAGDLLTRAVQSATMTAIIRNALDPK